MFQGLEPPGGCLNALQRAVDSMDGTDVSKEDPAVRYGQLVGSPRAHRAPPGVMEPPQTQKHLFTQGQLQQLRVQIMAYRLLARNQPLTQTIIMGIQVIDRKYQR